MEVLSQDREDSCLTYLPAHWLHCCPLAALDGFIEMSVTYNVSFMQLPLHIVSFLYISIFWNFGKWNGCIGEKDASSHKGKFNPSLLVLTFIIKYRGAGFLIWFFLYSLLPLVDFGNKWLCGNTFMLFKQLQMFAFLNQINPFAFLLLWQGWFLSSVHYWKPLICKSKSCYTRSKRKITTCGHQKLQTEMSFTTLTQ